MFHIQNLSIRKKLLLIILSISTTVLFIACMAFIAYQVFSFRHSMVKDLFTLADVIGYNCNASLMFKDHADAMETLGTLKARGSIVAAYLYTRNGEILASYLCKDAREDLLIPAPREDGYFFKKDRLVLNKKIMFQGAEIGRVCLQSDLKDMHIMLKKIISTIVIILLITFFITYIISSRLTRIVSDPISELAQLAKTISKDENYFLRAKKHGEDEIGSLYDAINEMLDEIQKRDTALMSAKHEAEGVASEARGLAEETERINLELEREISVRKIVEKELQKHRINLEELVEERTAQLTEANKQLRQEIMDRLQAEKKMKISLEEKILLLGEVHHRVKNNLQIIASLLDLSKGRTTNQEALNLLSEAHAKIHTMALIHTQLYRNERFDQINMERHARDLISHLSSLYGKGKDILPVIHAPDIHLSVTQAIPCALILNELISNAYKHAFERTSEGTIEVSIERSPDETIFMKVKDDGSGIPGGVDIDGADSLGLKLVRNLVLKQLRGKLQINRYHGTEVFVEFKKSGKETDHAQTDAC